jgi:putative transposase
MPRQARVAPGGYYYHVLNRSAGRFTLFRSDRDFQAFHRLILEANKLNPIQILAWCVMSNHWHFVVYAEHDGQLTRFFRWLTNTHAVRWRVAHGNRGYGHVYQGRFKNFAVQDDQHLLTVIRYVERNPLTARMVKSARHWHYSSLGVRYNEKDEMRGLLSDWPIPRPRDWQDQVDEPVTAKEVERLQRSVKRGTPFGDDPWTHRVIDRLKLKHTVNAPGRQVGWRKKAGKRPK